MFIEHGLGHSIQVLFFLPLSAFIAIEIMDAVIFLVVDGEVFNFFLNWWKICRTMIRFVFQT